MIYKIAIRDGKGRERNGKMLAFNFDSGRPYICMNDIPNN
jgi:hypothetical protein